MGRSIRHEAIVQLLFEMDAAAEAPDSDGRKPLSWAALYRHEPLRGCLNLRKCDLCGNNLSSTSLATTYPRMSLDVALALANIFRLNVMEPTLLIWGRIRASYSRLIISLSGNLKR